MDERSTDNPKSWYCNPHLVLALQLEREPTAAQVFQAAEHISSSVSESIFQSLEIENDSTKIARVFNSESGLQVGAILSWSSTLYPSDKPGLEVMWCGEHLDQSAFSRLWNPRGTGSFHNLHILNQVLSWTHHLLQNLNPVGAACLYAEDQDCELIPGTLTVPQYLFGASQHAIDSSSFLNFPL